MAEFKCAGCRENKEETLFYALSCVVWYDGHCVWLRKLRDDLAKLKECDTYVLPIDTKEWHTEKHTIWMLLVGMFGDWGTSIRSGWIDKPKECVEFIDALCEELWGEEDGI